MGVADNYMLLLQDIKLSEDEISRRKKWLTSLPAWLSKTKFGKILQFILLNKLEKELEDMNLTKLFCLSDIKNEFPQEHERLKVFLEAIKDPEYRTHACRVFSDYFASEGNNIESALAGLLQYTDLQQELVISTEWMKDSMTAMVESVYPGASLASCLSLKRPELLGEFLRLQHPTISVAPE